MRLPEHLLSFVLVALFSTSIGCSSEGDGGSGDGGGDPCEGIAEDAASLYGLAVGARWTYDNVDYNLDGTQQETMLVKEITGCEEISFQDCQTGELRTYNAYVQETTGGNQTPGIEEARKLYMIVNGCGLVRVKQDYFRNDELDHWVTYSPYFLRIAKGPYPAGAEWDLAHLRCEYAEIDGADQLLDVDTPRYTHVIADPNETVAVEAGTYQTVHVRRTQEGSGDKKDFWFADGLGKVKEEGLRAEDNSLTSEENLTEYVAGSGACD